MGTGVGPLLHSQRFSFPERARRALNVYANRSRARSGCPLPRGWCRTGGARPRALPRNDRARPAPPHECLHRRCILVQAPRYAALAHRANRTRRGTANPARDVPRWRGSVRRGRVTLWGCVERRVNDWVRWRLANVSWRAKGSGDCTSSAVTTRFTVAGRERFIECDGGKALAPKARDRLIEIEATLLSAARKGS